MRYKSKYKKVIDNIDLGRVTVSIFNTAHELNSRGLIIDSKDVKEIVDNSANMNFNTQEDMAEWIAKSIRQIRDIDVRVRVEKENEKGDLSVEVEDNGY
jgi:NADPH-dependent 7-cyano-7-deazaguanine reductase QueF-like protein